MKLSRHLRQRKIIELINSGNIKTQEELASELKKCGIHVTQATVSRDIKQLGLVKSLSSSGEYQYVRTKMMDNALKDKLIKILSQSVVSMDVINNVIVVKTLSGTASAADEAIDSLEFSGVAGTIAGNNVIFILARDSQKAESVYKSIKMMVQK